MPGGCCRGGRTAQERAEKRLYAQSSQLMEQNYRQLHEDLQENARRVHDFHHHLRAILGMAESQDDQQVSQYIRELLEISYHDIQLCRSGSGIIDAVINCSAAEAAKQGITFRYETDITSPLPIPSVDLCAVLGNQVENALEACSGMPLEESRVVTVEVLQKQGFLLFRVTNSLSGSPFTAEGDLPTRKSDAGIHGMGIKNLRETAEKYSGWLKNTYQDHWFISEALLCIPMESTPKKTARRSQRGTWLHSPPEPPAANEK